MEGKQQHSKYIQLCIKNKKKIKNFICLVKFKITMRSVKKNIATTLLKDGIMTITYNNKIIDTKVYIKCDDLFFVLCDEKEKTLAKSYPFRELKKCEDLVLFQENNISDDSSFILFTEYIKCYKKKWHNHIVTLDLSKATIIEDVDNYYGDDIF